MHYYTSPSECMHALACSPEPDKTYTGACMDTDCICMCMQGEAELKLLDRMMRPWAGVQPADRHIVVAGDSDLALMACFLPASTNVSLLREYVVLKKTSWKLFSMAKLASKWQQQHAFMQVGKDNWCACACTCLACSPPLHVSTCIPEIPIGTCWQLLHLHLRWDVTAHLLILCRLPCNAASVDTSMQIFA